MKKRFLIGVLALLIVALASWGWYFFTHEPERADRITTPVLRGARRQPSTPQWRAASSKERSAAIASIVAQLEAFKADDYQRAAKYQSAGLKHNFPSTEDFRHVIQTSYPEFAHYKIAKFGAARALNSGKLIELPITLTGASGVTVHAVYSMVLESAGYRIAGVSGGSTPRTAPTGAEKSEPFQV